MKIGVDSAIVWVKIASKARMEQPGGPDSAVLRMIGLVEHRRQHGTVVEVEQVHIPLEAHGTLALAMDRVTKIGSGLWVIGQHHEDHYVDRYGEEQHKLKIGVQSFEVNRSLDFHSLFQD